jgi:hypothetical protein
MCLKKAIQGIKIVDRIQNAAEYSRVKANVKRSTLVAAFAVAICADLIEIGFGAIFSEGFVSPFDDFMDAVVCVILTAMLGWHIAFIPSFLFKLIPMVDLAPTWTIAVLIASRGLRSTTAKDVTSPPTINLKPEDVSVRETEEKPSRVSPEKI